MDEIGQLRIYVSEKYFPIFHEISGNQIFKQNVEFFLYCTFVGEKNGRKTPLEKRQELCRAITLTDYDKTAIKALFLKGCDKLSTFKVMVRHAEEYAIGGFEYLLEHVLADITFQDDRGVWNLKSSVHSELQLALMKYVLKERMIVPF